MRLKALARVKGQTFNQDPVSLVQSRPRLRALQVVGEAQGPVVLRARAAGQDPGAWRRSQAGVRGSNKLRIQRASKSRA